MRPFLAGGIAGIVGNPAEIIMVRMQGDFAKPPEKRLNYKHCFDGLYRVSMVYPTPPGSVINIDTIRWSVTKAHPPLHAAWALMLCAPS